MRRLAVGVAVTAAVVLAARADAQASSLVGSVRVKDATAPLTIAEVEIPALGLKTRVNEQGEFSFPSVPEGRYFVIVRAIGYSPRGDSLTMVAGRETRRHFDLPRATTQLDTAVIMAPAQRYISPLLRGFEQRQKLGIGRFIGEDELRKSDNRTFQDLVRKLPGLTVMRLGQSSVAVSTRHTGAPTKALMSGSQARCYVTLYQDGVLTYDQVLMPNVPPPTLENISVREFAGIEFYPGEASIPAQYRSSPCGLILLWTRER